ncbi:MAG: type II toxin-antitoxin system VapC family toxin [Spirochaetales bacterium]
MDTSVIVAAVHANHPSHRLAAPWLDSAFDAHELFVAHPSLIESYAVLTRLPAKYRFSPSEADTVLRETLQDNVTIAPFTSQSSWSALSSLVEAPAAGGAAYDALIIHLLKQAGVDVITTFNVTDFTRLARTVRIRAPGDTPTR